VFLVFEHVPGESLTKLIGGHPLNPRRALEIAIQAADALAEAHAAGIVHRDVRPDNIVVTPRGQAKLLDTGLAGFTGGGALRAKATSLPDTSDEVTAATFRYLSPEQALGEPVDDRSDIFSLGAVLYEMLTGKPAFDGGLGPRDDRRRRPGDAGRAQRAEHRRAAGARCGRGPCPGEESRRPVPGGGGNGGRPAREPRGSTPASRQEPTTACPARRRTSLAEATRSRSVVVMVAVLVVLAMVPGGCCRC
jgi:serine/threonine protein kinase